MEGVRAGGMRVRPVPMREAVRRLVEAARAAGLQLDPRTVQFQEKPYPCYEYVLRLGQAHSVLCMPAEVVEPEGWQEKTYEYMRRARRYLERFVEIQERVDQAARGIPRFQQVLKP
ncbi:MAG: hypothetical protein QN193_02615 [Armatimonadota bacterium]|nr:hypothetical protein [Armatimonadota bacterium]MDR7444656.1 hypothetical protein [Armatimonadota bacterium]MDR7569482.1 hypothetical protein [Armatimonadota bacterium]MDR7613635.1 hypothetical protein [Armatimonadota bacterium]